MTYDEGQPDGRKVSCSSNDKKNISRSTLDKERETRPFLARFFLFAKPVSESE